MKPYDPSAAVAEFEAKWFDHGDERYGLARHNNGILRQQLDWIRSALDAAYRAGEAGKEAAVAEAKRQVWRKAFRCLAPASDVALAFTDSRVREAVAEYERGYGKARDITGFRMKMHATMDSVDL